MATKSEKKQKSEARDREQKARQAQQDEDVLVAAMLERSERAHGGYLMTATVAQWQLDGLTEPPARVLRRLLDQGFVEGDIPEHSSNPTRVRLTQAGRDMIETSTITQIIGFRRR